MDLSKRHGGGGAAPSPPTPLQLLLSYPYRSVFLVFPLPFFLGPPRYLLSTFAFTAFPALISRYLLPTIALKFKLFKNAMGVRAPPSSFAIISLYPLYLSSSLSVSPLLTFRCTSALPLKLPHASLHHTCTTITVRKATTPASLRHICASITSWKATAPCFPECNYTISNLYLRRICASITVPKATTAYFPPRPNVTTISNLYLRPICTSISSAKSDRPCFLSATSAPIVESDHPLLPSM